MFGLSSKTLRRSCNHCILRVHQNVLRKNKKSIFRKKYKFYIILWDWEENFGGVVNTAFTETIGTLCWSVFFMFFVFSAFFYIQGNISCLSSKTPRRGCNHCILRVHRNVLRKNKKLDFPKNVKFLCHSRRLQENLRRGDQHCIHRDKGIFMQIIFFKIYVFLTFFHLERNIFRHLLNTLRRRCNYCILRVHRNVMRKNKSLKFRKKVWIYYLSRRLRGNFWRGGQHCIYRDNRIFMQINFLNYMFP